MTEALKQRLLPWLVALLEVGVLSGLSLLERRLM